jgi:hypothetical protein
MAAVRAERGRERKRIALAPGLRPVSVAVAVAAVGLIAGIVAVLLWIV